MYCSTGEQVPIFHHKDPPVMMFHLLGVHSTTKIIMTAQMSTSSPSCSNTGDMTFLKLLFWKVKNVLEDSFRCGVSFGVVLWGLF